jgi:DNA-binding IclR family transcriptional regulator
MADTSKTVHQAMLTLATLREAGPGTISELGRRLGLSRTVVSRLVGTLEQHALVRRTSDGVDLGFGLIDLAAGLAGDLRETVRPFLQELATAFHETAVLAIADHDMAVAVDQVVPDRRVVRIHYGAGSRHPLSAAAHGRAILAFADRATYDRLTRDDGTDPGLVDELAAIRRRGYALSHNELESGVAGLAAPVLDASGVAVASIGVVAPALRLPAERSLAPAVLDAADRATVALADVGGTRPPVRTIA